MGYNRKKRFPNPTFTTVTEDGEIFMEWIKPLENGDHSRATILIDGYDDETPTAKLVIWGIVTKKEYQKEYMFKTLNEIASFLEDELGLKCID